MGNKLQALEDFQAVLKLTGDEDARDNICSIYTSLGQASFAAGAAVDAIHNYTLALSYSSHSPELYFERGKAFMALENIDMARLDFEAGLEIDPPNLRLNGT
jgi:tetratricopeptide (TPR) repeat protein